MQRIPSGVAKRVIQLWDEEEEVSEVVKALKEDCAKSPEIKARFYKIKEVLKTIPTPQSEASQDMCMDPKV